MNKKLLYWFAFLVFYVVAQSIWWMYRITSLSRELYSVKEMQTKYFQIAGEGVVFLLIVLIGFWLTYRSVKKELRLTNQQRNFLLSITHELKTPIASIKLYLQTLTLRKLDETKQKEILEKTLKDSDRLNKLVENILLATKLEDKALPLQKEELNLSDLVNDIAVGILESNPKPIEVEFFIAPDIYFLADREAMVSMVTNLLDNAIKYSEKGGLVAIHLLKNDQEIIFRVADEGAGISEKNRKLVFKKFYRIGDENTRKAKGTGLGLYIVKNLVESHNGTIKVEPNKIKGTVFTVNFRQ